MFNKVKESRLDKQNQGWNSAHESVMAKTNQAKYIRNLQYKAENTRKEIYVRKYLSATKTLFTSLKHYLAYRGPEWNQYIEKAIEFCEPNQILTSVYEKLNKDTADHNTLSQIFNELDNRLRTESFKDKSNEQQKYILNTIELLDTAVNLVRHHNNLDVPQSSKRKKTEEEVLEVRR